MSWTSGGCRVSRHAREPSLAVGVRVHGHQSAHLAGKGGHPKLTSWLNKFLLKSFCYTCSFHKAPPFLSVWVFMHRCFCQEGPRHLFPLPLFFQAHLFSFITYSRDPSFSTTLPFSFPWLSLMLSARPLCTSCTSHLPCKDGWATRWEEPGFPHPSAHFCESTPPTLSLLVGHSLSLPLVFEHLHSWAVSFFTLFPRHQA